MAFSNRAKRVNTPRYGKVSGPTDVLNYLARSDIHDRHKSILRQTAQRLILENRVPESYAALVADPFAEEKFSVVDLVCEWLSGIERDEALPLSEIGFPKLQSRFLSHLHDVFYQ